MITSPGRNFVTLKVTTEDGIYGLGDATLNGRELAVASYLADHVLPCLVGRDARRIEDIWQYLYKGAYWRRGPVTMTAIAAVDTALWDIKGKALETPVYNLLGGRSRDSVLVYGHANGRDIEETVKAVGALRHARLQGDSRAERHPGPCQHVWRRPRHDAVRARREGPAVGESLEHREVPELRAGALRAPPQGVRRRRASAARRAPSLHAHRGGAARHARSSRITCSGWRIRRPPKCRTASA